jgi:hypothetical protein
MRQSAGGRLTSPNLRSFAAWRKDRNIVLWELHVQVHLFGLQRRGNISVCVQNLIHVHTSCSLVTIFRSESHVLKAESEFYPKKGNKYVSDCANSRFTTRRPWNVNSYINDAYFLASFRSTCTVIDFWSVKTPPSLYLRTENIPLII